MSDPSNPSKLLLLSTEDSTGSLGGTVSVYSATPKGHTRFPSSSELSPTRLGIRVSSDQSPRAEETSDLKRYEQLSKICSQMKEKEAKLNQQAQNLEELKGRTEQLNRKLAEMTELSQKAQNSSGSSGTFQGIQQTLAEKNQLINAIESELVQLQNEQKQRVTNDELVISGFIKKVTVSESQISQTLKKSTLATSKLLELQTKAIGDSPQGLSAEQQSTLQRIDEILQNARSQLHRTREQNSSLESSTSKPGHQPNQASPRSEELHRHIAQLQVDISSIRAGQKTLEKRAKVEQVRAEVEASFKAKLAAASEVLQKVDHNPPSQENVADIRKRFAELQQEKVEITASEAKLTTDLEINLQEIARLQESLKKEKTHAGKKQVTPEEATLKDLHREIDSLKKQHKELKAIEKELSKDNAVADLEAMKKKLAKKENSATPENIQELRHGKEKAEKELQETRLLYRGLEKEQKNHAPSQLIEEYKKKVADKQQELAATERLSVDNAQLRRDVEEIFKQKDTQEWERNPVLGDLDSRIKMERQRIEELTEKTKTDSKKVAQATTKFNEFKTAYPDFVLPSSKTKGKQPEVKVEPKKEEKKDEKKGLAPTAKKLTTDKEEEASPKQEQKSAKKKNKGDAKSGSQIISSAISEVIVDQSPKPDLTSPVVVEEGQSSKKKKGKKQPIPQSEQKVKATQQVAQIGVQQPSELEEIERHLMQAAESPAEEEVEKPVGNMKASKKQDKKKAQRGKQLVGVEESNSEFRSDILSNLPRATAETASEGYKTLVFPVAVAILIAVIFLMIK